MITITLQHDPDGWIESFCASGHAGYAADGPDIICAAVSVLAQTAIGSLQPGEGLWLCRPDGSRQPVEARGFNHFQSGQPA